MKSTQYISGTVSSPFLCISTIHNGFSICFQNLTSTIFIVLYVFLSICIKNKQKNSFFCANYMLFLQRKISTEPLIFFPPNGVKNLPITSMPQSLWLILLCNKASNAQSQLSNGKHSRKKKMLVLSLPK